MSMFTRWSVSGAAGLLALSLNGAPVLAQGDGTTTTTTAPAESAALTAITSALMQLEAPPTPPAWAVGQEATYLIQADSGAGDLTIDTRFALTGEEEDYYWFEVNLSNFGGALGQMVAPFTSGVHLRFLTKSTDPDRLRDLVTAGLSNPADAVDEQTLKKIQIQLEGKSLWEIAITEAKQLAEDNFDPTMLDGVDDDTTTEEVAPPDIEVDSGKEDIEVAAGPFLQSTFWDVAVAAATSTTNAHVNFHENVPLIPLAKFVLNGSGEDYDGNLQVRAELIAKGNTGATTMTVGEPKPFVFNDFLNEVLGGSAIE